MSIFVLSLEDGSTESNNNSNHNAGFFVYFSTKCAFPMNVSRYSPCAKMSLFYYLLLLDKNEMLDIIKFIN